MFSLAGWSPHLPTGFLVPRGTPVPAVHGACFAYGAFTLSGRLSQNRSVNLPGSSLRSLTPACTHAGLGSSAFARRYSGNHFCLLLLRLLRCFSSPGALPRTMDSCAGTQGPALRGLPHSDTRGSSGICPSPRLFAACRVFRRPAAPRHPPCALPSLATTRRLACRQASFSQFFSDFLILTSWFPNGTLPPVPQLWLVDVFGSLLVLLVFGFQGTNMTFRLFYQPLKTKIQIKF